MSLTVSWYDGSGTYHDQECDYVEEGETGLMLYDNPGPEQVGYVPYEYLQHAVPSDGE